MLDRLLGGSTDYASLLPWNGGAEHPEAIRKYRDAERQTRTTRQQTRRASRRRKNRR
jgi:hypothetical protein